MENSIYVLCALMLVYLSYGVYEVYGFYKRYHEVTGKGFLNFLFSLDRACSVFFTDDNYDKLKKLSKEKGVSIDSLLNCIVSSLKDSEDK